MTSLPYKNISNSQNGFASITVALILVVILSLLTVAFAQLARREQSTSLDKQLAIQANYAAESGINDVVRKLNISADAFGDPDPNTCLTHSDLPDYTLDSRIGASYSCVLLNLKPKNLVKDLDAGSAWNQVFSTVGTSGALGLKIQWSHKAANPGGSTAKAPRNVNDKSFVPTSQWSSPAVLQFSITPLTNTFDRDYLINNTYTAYLYPSKSGSSPTSVVYSSVAGSQAPIVSGDCSPSGDCTAQITGVTNASKYLIHVIGYYDDSKVIISSTDAGVSFVHGQAVIDATGKARDVLKRLQVRVPIDGSNNIVLPNYALEGQSICKRLLTQPNETHFRSVGGGEATEDTDPCNLLYYQP